MNERREINNTAQLERVAKLPYKSAERMVYDGRHLFLCHRRDSQHCLSVIDVQQPAEPRELEELKFKARLGAMHLRGNIIYLSEARRAINYIRTPDRGGAEYFDCALTLGRSIYDFEVLGDFIVLACDHEGVGLMHVGGDGAPDILHRHKLGESFVESVVVCDDLIVAAGYGDGLCSLRINAGKLEIVERFSKNGFRPRRLHRVAGEVWACGVDEDDQDGILVFDPTNLQEPRLQWFFEDRTVGEQLLTVAKGKAISFRDETCVLFDIEAKERKVLFEMYARDDDGSYLELPAVRSRDELPEGLDCPRTSLDEVQWVQPISTDHWAISHSDELAIYRLSPGAFLRRCVGSSV